MANLVIFPSNAIVRASEDFKESLERLRVDVALSTDQEEVDAIWQWAKYIERQIALIANQAGERMNQLQSQGDRPWAI